MRPRPSKVPHNSALEEALGTIVTTCPITGKVIPTGIETDADTFCRISSIAGRVWCPHCQTEHEWSVERAKFTEIYRDDEG
jgi:hypothetical protein